MWLYGWRNWTALPYCTILFTLAKQGAYFNLTQDERFWSNILEVIWFRKKRLPVVSIQVNSFEEEKGFSAVLIRDNEFISKQPCIPGIYFFVSPVPKIQPCIQIKLCCYLTFSKYQSISCSCCSWSEVYMILAFLPHPICLFAYFRLFTSNSRKLEPFLISLKGSSYRESTLHVYRSYSRLF